MSARKLRSSLLAVLTIGVAMGCTIAMPPPRQAIPTDAQRAIDLLLTRWKEVTDLRALANIVVDRGGQRQQLSSVLLAQAPGSLRLEALSPFGQPFLVAVVHDGRMTAYNAITGEAVVGDATAETTARLLYLPVEPQDMVAIMAGHAVPPRDVRTAEMLPPDAMGPSISLAGAVHEKRVWMDFTTGVVTQVQIVGGRAAAIVTYLRDDDGRLTGFDVSAGERYLTGTVRYRSLATGVGLTADRFTLTLPSDAKIQTLR